MNLSMKWLSDYVELDIEPKKFCYDMTMSGSKVEGFKEEKAEISNVVVGKVISVVPHENSDHLVICQIDIGSGEPTQIVTGAKNVNAGDLVPVALNNSTLPNGVKIKKGKLRGVESNGMLCSLSELKLTTADFPYAIEDGIFIIKEECEIGQDICTAIGLDDTTVEFEITSNRPDCLSVIGLAREAHATFDTPLNIKESTYNGVGGKAEDYINVTVENQTLCKRYIAGIVKNAKVEKSPRWMRERLRASGIRPINNFVDITNFVMLEYGQPMHAFDLKYVEGSEIIIRNAKLDEEIVTLDGATRKLSPEMLVIADKIKPVAVAGVMGGEYSGIMADTSTVVFESASFDGGSVRLTAKKLGMRSDSSARFEKGLHPDGTSYAIRRALELVELLGAGEVVTELIDKDYSSKEVKKVSFDPGWTNRLLGTNISKSDMEKYLNKLGFKIINDEILVPYFRIDIDSKADIAEEVARIYGYNNIPATFFKGVAKAKLTKEQKFNKLIQKSMVSLGCYEISTFSFISPKNFDKIQLPKDSALRDAVTISNPLGEDTSVMRTTIIPSMCEILAKNYNSRNLNAKLFELGTEYIKVAGEPLPNEPAVLSIGMYGENVDFYDIKGAVEGLLGQLRVFDYEVEAIKTTSFTNDEMSAFHPGRCAVAFKGDTAFAIFGELHPKVLETYGIGVKSYVAKLLVPEMFNLSQEGKSYEPLPKFPASSRDLSLVCDESVPVAKLERAIKSAVGAILEKVTLFDVYRGKQIEDGKKSVSYSVSMRSHDGTLTDEQADAAVKRILKAMKDIDVELRS